MTTQIRSLDQIKNLIRDVPDFPKKGILFKDITPVLEYPGALPALCDELSKPFMNKGIQKVLAIESRGFFFGVGIAERLNVGFIPVRKSGKLPWKTVSESYALEYGEASLEIHQDAIKPGESVLIVDDVLATGGTLRASHRLVEKLGGKVAGVACLLEIGFLNGRSLLHPLNPTVLWTM